MKKIICSLALSLTFLVVQGQSEEEKVTSTVTKAAIEGHIHFIASDELKGRQTGSPELDIAARYLATTFMRYGVKPVPGATEGYFQPVSLSRTTAPARVGLQLNGKEAGQVLSVKSRNQNFQGKAVFLHYGQAQDYKKKDVTGKLVIVQAGLPGKTGLMDLFSNSDAKRKLAREKGAIGLVELVALPEVSWLRAREHFYQEKLGLASSQNQEPFSHLWLQDLEHTWATALPKKKSLAASLQVSGIQSTLLTSKNVVGMVEGTDPVLKNEFVIYSAHYDHEGIGRPNTNQDSIYNGARDNAVGTVTVLSMAKNLARYPAKRSALFILFTAEEKGLLGSQWYIENPLLPLRQMVYCFNSDNAGYNDTSLITVIGLNRTTAEASIKEAAARFGLKAANDPAPEQGLFDRSDNVHFAAKGIPAPTFSLGFTSFSGDVLKYYHKTADNPDTLDYDYLYKFFQAYVLAGRYIANDPIAPTWKKGDKYEPASKKLYGK